jgi:hypothetical protein
MFDRTVTGMLIAGVIAATSMVQAQDHVVPKVAEAPVLPLSAKHRAALIAEMLGVKAGVAELSGSFAMGEWKATAQQAERIRDSYIMKQKLTSSELAELEHALPADFIDKDSEFHSHANGLAHAAMAHNYELEVFYFSKIMEGCGACHTRYATDVFKGFKSANHTQASH